MQLCTEQDKNSALREVDQALHQGLKQGLLVYFFFLKNPPPPEFSPLPPPAPLPIWRAPARRPRGGAAEKPLDGRCPPRRRRGSREQQLAGGAAELRLRHQPIDEPQTPRLLGAHGLARQHHLHRGPDADRAYAPHGAAEARVDAELHLRESQRESV